MNPRSNKGEGLPRPSVINCAAYTRQSVEEGTDSGFSSIDAQREACEAYVAAQKLEGWVCLPDRFDDPGFSGATRDRPALKRLLHEVETGNVNCIVFYRLDRLSRFLPDFVRIMEVLDAHNCAIVSITEQFNTATPSGRLHVNMVMSFAQHEREVIALRTKDKMSAARRKGRWTGGMPILGYDVDPKGGRLLVNEAEADRVRTIFEIYPEKGGLIETARELNRRRWTTKQWITKTGRERGGSPFTKTGLFNLLTNMTYIGKVDYDGAVYPGEHAAIVHDAVWQKVQKLLKRNGRAGGREARNKYGALLRGLLWCLPCGCTMHHAYSQRGDRRYRYYVCGKAQKQGWDSCPTKSLPAGEIERFVVDRIRSIGTDPKLLDEVVRKAEADVQERVDLLAHERHDLERGLKRCAAEVKRIVGKSTAVPRLADLQQQTTVAEQRLAEIRREETAIVRVDEADVAAALRTFDPIWENLSPREQSRIVHLLIERVGFDPATETVAVTFRPGGIRTLAEEVA